MPIIQIYERQILPSGKTSAAPIEQVPNLNAEAIGKGLGALGEGLSDITSAITKIQLDTELYRQKIRAAREVSEGIAEYSNIVNSYMLDIENKDPRDVDYLDGFKKLFPKIDAIYDNKSDLARQELYNKFVIWKERDAANIASQAVTKEVSLLKSEIPHVRDFFVNNGDLESYKQYLATISGALNLDRKIFGNVAMMDVLINDFNEKYAVKSKSDAVNFLTQHIADIASVDGWDAAEDYLASPDTVQQLSQFGLDLASQENVRQIVKNRIKDLKLKETEKLKNTLNIVAKHFTDRLIQGNIEEPDVWSMKIDTPNHLGDIVVEFKKEWADIVASFNNRRRLEQERDFEQTKKVNYSPELAGELLADAKSVKSEDDKNNLNKKAIEAYANNKISKEDLKNVITLASGELDKLMDSIISKNMTALRNTMLGDVGSTDEEARTLLTNKIMLLKQQGASPEEIRAALLSFNELRKVKMWAANIMIEREISDMFKQDRPATIDEAERRLLQIQRKWLRKAPEQLMKEFELWLKLK